MRKLKKIAQNTGNCATVPNMQKGAKHMQSLKQKEPNHIIGSAQVYVDTYFPIITENERFQNTTSTPVQDDVRTGTEQPKKVGRNRALEFPPDKLLALVKAHFKYSATRGKLFYRQGKLRGHAVKTRKLGSGYVTTTWLDMEWRIHRLIWMLVNDAALQPSDEIDHRNQIRHDNRPDNLRKATHAQNQWNAGIRKDNTSGIKGVAMRDGKYIANISINGKVKYLGTFKTEADAVEEYQKKALELRGEYARFA